MKVICRGIDLETTNWVHKASLNYEGCRHWDILGKRS